MELGFYPEVILGAILHCPGETREFELRGVKGNLEILVLARVWLPLYPQVLNNMFYPYQRQSTFIAFMIVIC